MSTVTESAICPECNYEEALFEMDLAHLEMLFCPRCGFERSINYSGNKETRKTAFGAVRMQFSKGHVRIGAIIEPVTHEIIDEFQQMIDEGKIMERGSYLTRWDTDRKFGEILIGSTKNISFI